MDIFTIVLLIFIIAFGTVAVYGVYYMLFKVGPTEKEINESCRTPNLPSENKNPSPSEEVTADSEFRRLRLAELQKQRFELEQQLGALQEARFEELRESSRRDLEMQRLWDEATRQQREHETRLEAAREAKRASGRAEVVPGRVVVITDVSNDEADAYSFTNTSSDRAGLTNVTDVSSTSPFGSTVVGLFVGDRFDWQGTDFIVSEALSREKWIERSGTLARTPPKGFTNTEYGVSGNPTHRRR